MIRPRALDTTHSLQIPELRVDCVREEQIGLRTGYGAMDFTCCCWLGCARPPELPGHDPLQQSLAHSPVATSTSSAAGRIQFCKPAYSDLLAIFHDELTGNSESLIFQSPIFPPQDRFVLSLFQLGPHGWKNLKDYTCDDLQLSLSHFRIKLGNHSVSSPKTQFTAFAS